MFRFVLYLVSLYKYMKHALSASLFFVLILSSCKESKPVEEDKTIDIVVSEKNREMMSRFFDAFIEEHPDYSLNLQIMNDEKTDYYLRHDRLDGEIVILDDLNYVNENSSRFMKLTTSDYFFRYSRYIQNYLSAADQEMYCLPSPGCFYCYCVNDDLLSSLNRTFPSDIDELIDFSSSVSNYVRPLSSYNFACSEYLDLFLQLSLGQFFSTTHGFDLFRDYRFSEDRLYDSDHFDEFVNILKEYSVVARSEERVIREDAFSAFLNQSTCILSLNMDFDFESKFREKGGTFEYSFHPYLGSSSGDEVLATSSDFFVSVLKKGYQKSSKRSIDEFLDFFASKDGQSYLVMDEDGNRKSNRLSYLKNSDIRLEGKLSGFQKYLDSGNVFILDDFLSSFRISERLFESFFNGEIGYVSMVNGFDENMRSYRLIEKHRYVLEQLKSLSLDLSRQRYELFSMLYYELKKKSSIDLMILPQTFQRLSIYDGVIYEKDVNVIFDSSCSLVPVYLDGLSLKGFISAFQKEQNHSDYLSFGIVSSGDSFESDQNRIQDDASYLIFVPEETWNGNSSALAKVGESVLALDLFSYTFLVQGETK